MNTGDAQVNYTVEDVRNTYGEAKAKEERYTEWVVYYVYRPLSFFITPWFLRKGLTPSNVTLISLILALSLPFVAYWFPAPYVFVGLIAVLISVFDCVDGNIARVTKSASKTGGYFDFITDILYRVLAYLAIGIMVSQAIDVPALIAGISTEMLLIAAMLAILARMCRMFVASETETIKVSPNENDDQTKGWLDGYFFPFFSGLDWGLPFLIVFFGSLGLLHWLAIWLLVYSLLDFLHTQYSSFSRLQSA